ncbi:hypothetical protein D9M68_629510 [compost metagenome]
MVVTHAANDDSAVPSETSVEDAPRVIVGGQEGVHLIDQQRRCPQLDGAEQRSRGDVGHLQWPVSQLAQGGEQDGLPATLLRGGDVGDGGHLHHVDEPGEGGPQCSSAQSFLVGDHMARQGVGDVVQQVGAIHRIRPRVDLGEDPGIGSFAFNFTWRGQPVELSHAEHLGLFHLHTQTSEGGRVFPSHGTELLEDGRGIERAGIGGQASNSFVDGALGLESERATHGQPSSRPGR